MEAVAAPSGEHTPAALLGIVSAAAVRAAVDRRGVVSLRADRRGSFPPCGWTTSSIWRKNREGDFVSESVDGQRHQGFSKVDLKYHQYADIMYV